MHNTPEMRAWKAQEHGRRNEACLPWPVVDKMHLTRGLASLQAGEVPVVWSVELLL
jgi:hypothetical protein